MEAVWGKVKFSMLIGRDHEYTYLEEYRKRPGSQLLVFYGQKFLGKTAFLLDFCKDRPFSYCLAKPGCEDRILEELKSEAEKLSQYPKTEKKLLIIDEFQHLSKSERFMPFCLNLLEKESILILFVSSACSWVESSMVKCFGKNAARISGFYKFRELSFAGICKEYPDYPKEELFLLYSVLGGVPGLWNFMDMKKGAIENIREQVLSDRSYLRHAGYQYCLEGLRESGVYDTILTAMAQGNAKLNDLHRVTGYSRAKISVYLKALMEQGQIEKVYSIDCPGRENAQKGIYEISSHFTDFWFTFIYLREKELIRYGEAEFYDRYIKEKLADYCNPYFQKIVKEYFVLCGIVGKDQIARAHRFLGKNNRIDLIWKQEEGYCAVKCGRLKAMTTYEDYRKLTLGAKEAGVSLNGCYLISGRDFDEKLTLEAKMKPQLRLLTFDEIMKAFLEN